MGKGILVFKKVEVCVIDTGILYRVGNFHNYSVFMIANVAKFRQISRNFAHQIATGGDNRLNL